VVAQLPIAQSTDRSLATLPVVDEKHHGKLRIGQSEIDESGPATVALIATVADR
jgi:hypothetical protein